MKNVERMSHGAKSLLVNLGCGSRFHRDWLNIDRLRQPGVLGHDLRSGIPLEDGVAAAIYQSHLLEHLERDDVGRFLCECRRVLEPGGYLRVLVPDLESCARDYLAALERVLAGDRNAIADHEWMVMELVDQLARERSGGQMAEYLSGRGASDREFILRRIGAEGEALMTPRSPETEGLGFFRRASGSGSLLSGASSRLRERLRSLVKGFRPESARWLAVGRFRLSGEVHKWMYDRVSLRICLEQAGFGEVVVCRPNESGISGFADFHLEVDEAGRVIKPDSLIMEARRVRKS